MECSISVNDRIAAYRLFMGNLPTADRWAGALRQRQDGSSVAGVFAVLVELRKELMAKIGDLVDTGGCPQAIQLSRASRGATIQDALTALELALGCLPARAQWGGAVAQQHGTTPDGVFCALREIRRALHECVGDVLQQAANSR